MRRTIEMKTIQRSSRLVIRRYSYNNHNNRPCTSQPEQWRYFSMSPLTTQDQREQCLTIAPFCTNKTLLQVQQQSFYQPCRTMVTVTQTKVAELQPQDDGLDGISSSNNNTTLSSPTYITHSDDLIVTPSCLNRVEKLVQMRQQKDGNEDPYFLRVFVDAGGCSGFQYQFEIDHTLDTEEDGTDVVIVSALLDHKDNTTAITQTNIHALSLTKHPWDS
ncbi:iron-sulfur cluster insertion protein ErpA [Nitzschia inconspicua]|uniref:Iron-sulfur cluster insertion protein ErpA n=1 Tax=Nitzschia inconspicua TaxID=303405 RepID=A0A9K3K6E5_9STRA|nr:iron-sulfur cluster insertion protein ErpA [Nitzschia inconspicua]